MEKIFLQSVFFKKLKGINNVKIEFDGPLTAIMGVNGAGKTTIIHALACIYQPVAGEKGEDHHFPEFFIPNTDALWQGSEFHVVNKEMTRENTWETQSSRRYAKDSDRWAPRYASRPQRNVYYLGIDTCLPEIEKTSTMSRIHYTSEDRNDKLSKKVLETAAYVLNKPYSVLIDNCYMHHHFLGVCTQTGLKYSSLSMGTGEQRTIKILEKVMAAEPFSLILIDEIDLLLHVSALRRLIKKLYSLASDKHLQIVFTTHSLEIGQMAELVDIRYIRETREAEQTVVYTKITNDLVYDLTGFSEKKYKIYVEDQFAKAIILAQLRKNQMSSLVEVVTYGSIENAFTLAGSHILEGINRKNEIIVLDGDKYQSKDEKIDRIKKILTGTEDDTDEKREHACALIKEFLLPQDMSPEEFIHKLIVETFPHDNEIYRAADAIKAVCDKHQWVYEICQRTSLTETDIVREIFQYSFECDAFKNYIRPIDEWLLPKKE